MKDTEPEIKVAQAYCCWSRVCRLFWLVPALLMLLGILLAGGLFLRSDIYSFRPRLPKIMKLVEEQRAGTPVIPPFLARCIEHEAGDDFHITRVLLGNFGLNETTSLRWRVRQILWRISLKWHLSVQDRQLLYFRYMADLEGHMGIQHLARKLYQKPLETLDERQLASLLIFSRSPMQFMRDRALLEKLTDEMVSELFHS
ncbi:MAG: transglycosylase domain-containing protein [Verrucomicrobiaceae bacterium]|nr:transglycosylase domain-containing protein [Verrucomicrobiaceae bacterium]